MSRLNKNAVIDYTYKEKHGVKKYIIQNKWLYIMLIPGLLYLFIFNYLPMFGIVSAFKNFNMAKGFFASEWVGLANFRELFTNSPQFWNALKNTLLLSLYTIVFSFPAPIILAVLLNEMKHDVFKRTLQTVYYLPYFVSWVVVCSIISNFLSPTNGLVNYVIQALGGDPIAFLQKPQYFRTILVISDIWKEAGYGTIIYLAAITGIDQSIYEAASMDGAGRLQKILHITLPGISSTIVVMLVLRMGSIMTNGFERIFLLYNPLTYETSDVLDTFIYRIGVQNGMYSYSAAAGLFSSAVTFLLVIFTNYVSRKLQETSLW